MVRFALPFLFAATAFAAAPADHTITIFERRTIAIAVPEGWTFEEHRNDLGVQTVSLVDPSGEIHVDASFLPDEDNRLASREALEDEMRLAFADLLKGAVEKDFRFVYAKTVDGLEGHMVFTDKTLVAKKIVPKDDRRLATSGIRRWPGVFMLFTVLSNQTDSAAYKAAMRVITRDIRDTSEDSRA